MSREENNTNYPSLAGGSMQHSPIRKPLGTAIMLVLAGGANGAAAGDASAVAMDAAGNSVVTWQDNTGADGDLGGIFARYTAAAAPASATTFQVNTTTPGDQSMPVAAMAANGAFVVVWQSNDEGGDSGIYAQRYNADGSAVGGEFRVNTITTGAQQNPVVAMNANGDFVVAWEDALGDGSGFGIMARRYLADGTAQGDAFTVNNTTAGDQLNPAVALADSGTFTLSWHSSEGAILMQRFAADGSAVGSEQLVAALAPVSATAASQALAGFAKAVATGVDLKLTVSSAVSGNALVYTLKVQNNGSVTASSVQLVDTLPGGVAYVSGGGGGWSCNNNAGTVTCNLSGNLAAGAKSTFAIGVDTTGVNSTSLSNYAVVSSSVADDNNTDNSATTVTTVTSASGAASSTAAGAFGWFSLLLGLFGMRRRWR